MLTPEHTPRDCTTPREEGQKGCGVVVMSTNKPDTPIQFHEFHPIIGKLRARER